MYDWVPSLAGPVQLLMEDMLYAQVDWERVRACPAEARENLVQFVRRLMQLELDLLRNGLEAIPPFYDTLTDPVERLAIAMVNNSFDWVRIWVVFQNFISAKDVPSDKYLEYVIFSRYLFEAWVKRYRLGDYYDSMEKLEGTLLSYLGPEYACRPPFEEFYTLLKKRRAFEERQEAREKNKQKNKRHMAGGEEGSLGRHFCDEGAPFGGGVLRERGLEADPALPFGGQAGAAAVH